MLKNKLILTSALSLLILFQSGCLLNYSNDVVLRQDEPLRGLSFESEYAMHVFDQSVRRAQKTDSRKSTSSFNVPFIVGLSGSKTLSETAVRNDMGTLFDINQDGHITEYEVSLQPH